MSDENQSGLQELLERLRKLDEAATAAPWFVTSSGDRHWLREVRAGTPTGYQGLGFFGATDEKRAHTDARTVAELRTMLPLLLKVVEQLAEEREAVTALFAVTDIVMKIMNRVPVEKRGPLEQAHSMLKQAKQVAYERRARLSQELSQEFSNVSERSKGTVRLN